jgi:hypothetical protein
MFVKITCVQRQCHTHVDLMVFDFALNIHLDHVDKGSSMPHTS